LDAAEISLIIPTLNEAANLTPLAERIDAALRERPYELLIVDDNSRDNTQQVCDELSKRFPLRLITRTHPKDGLSGAVLHGMAEAKGDLLVVMDADLQHPPEKLPEIVQPLIDDRADFVIGSRYVKGGSIETGWSPYRALNSWVATVLARPFAGKVHDPMSGFIALRRVDYANARRLTPLGYKIGLELLCKTRAKRVVEVPIHFSKRLAGESKLSLKEQFRYLEHLSRLYDFSYPRLAPMLKFLIVTITSWSVAAGYYLGMRAIGWSVLASVIIAYLLAIAVTAVFHARYVRTQREFLLHPRPWLDFLVAAWGELIVCGLVAAYLIHRAVVPHEVDVFLLSFTAAMLVRYILRKELLLDVRGLRHEVRKDEMK
jgi:dolichol-phosphate mannosyltransferase